MSSRVLPVVLLALAAGCSAKTGDSPVDKVHSVKADDPRMNAAIQTARRSVNSFVSALKTPKPGQNGFSVKKAFTQGDKTEHMWLNSVSYDGRVFRGTLTNTPQMVTNVSIGAQVTVDPSKLSDWMYVDNGKLVGGYTIRALRDGMSAEERAKLDRELPFRIE